MRLHLESSKVIPCDGLIQKKTEYTIIYSSQGIFRVKNNSLIRMKIHDAPVRKIQMDGHTLWYDESKLADDEEWYQLPYDHTVEHITKTRHLVRPCCPVALFTEVRDDGSLKALYLETNEVVEAVADDVRAYLMKVAS